MIVYVVFLIVAYFLVGVGITKLIDNNSLRFHQKDELGLMVLFWPIMLPFVLVGAIINLLGKLVIKIPR